MNIGNFLYTLKIKVIAYLKSKEKRKQGEASLI